MDHDVNTNTNSIMPDSVHLIMRQLNDTLWKYIKESAKHSKQMSVTDLYNITKTNGFEIDTINSYFYSSKRQFNKRLSIQFNLKSPDTILTYIKIWHQGQVYETLFAKWKNKFE